MKKTARKRRGNSRYYLYFVFILLALFAVGTGIYFILQNVPWFNLKTVQISGNAAVADSLIQQVTNPYLGQNLLSIPTEDVKKDILKYSRIKSVKIKRRFFSTLLVTVQERKGFLYLKSLDGDLFPIDESGIVLSQYGNVYIENLPVMSVLIETSKFKPGVPIKNASLTRVLALHKKVIAEAPEFVPNISEYYTVDNVIYIIDARNGIRLIPSSENIAKQLSRYQFVQDNGNISNNSVLDLRFSDQVVVKAGN